MHNLFTRFLLIFFISSGCGAENPSSCPPNQSLKMGDNQSTCVPDCSAAQCPGRCSEGVCIIDVATDNNSTNNISMNNTPSTNNTIHSNNNSNGSTSSSTGETTPPSIVVDQALGDNEFCDAIFNKLYRTCLDSECNLTPQNQERFDGDYDVRVEQCVSSRNKPNFKRYYDFLAAASSCEAFRPIFCLGDALGDQCSCVATNAGDPCISKSDCTSDSQAQCIPSTYGYPEGYCTSRCANGRSRADYSTAYHGDASCGEGNICMIQESGGSANTFCMKGCTRQSDCREGYRCLFGGTQIGAGPFEGKFVRFCSPEFPPVACQSLRDCNYRSPCVNGTCDFSAVYQCSDEIRNSGKSSAEECVDNGGACQLIQGKTFCVVP